MTGFAERLQTAWRRHGFRLFGPLLVHNIKYYVRMYRINGRLGQQKSSVDSIPGVETYRAAYFSELKYDGESAKSANPYEPVREDEFDAVFQRLGIDRAKYHLVDIGSGKGRAVLLAARLGFGRVTGLEYSDDLHQVALQNMTAAKGHWPNVDRITLIQGDASVFDPPPPPTVYYMCNPFGEEVMSKFIARLVAKLKDSPGDCWIVYWNPTVRHVIDAEPMFEFKFPLTGHAVFRRCGQD